LQLATVEVFGEERHRAVAIQEVRFVTEDLMRGMNVSIQHRLTDYNNLPSTQFKDVKQVLKDGHQPREGAARDTEVIGNCRSGLPLVIVQTPGLFT
jgi:hypothetical protein